MSFMTYLWKHVPSETKEVNVKVFNVITRISEFKTLVNTLHIIVNANSIVQHVIQIKKGIIINVNKSPKSIARAKKIIFGILAHVFVRIGDT